eukprot:g2572.t1
MIRSTIQSGDVETMTKADMIRFIHSYADDAFLEEHKCKGRLKALKKTRTTEDLKQTMLNLLPKVSQKSLPARLLKENVRVTPTKKPLGDASTNTPPMSKLLKSSRKILAVSHATESAARDLLMEIENSPTSKSIMKSVKKAKKKKKNDKKSLFSKTPKVQKIAKRVITNTPKANVSKENTVPEGRAPNTIEKAHVRIQRLEHTLRDHTEETKKKDVMKKLSAPGPEVVAPTRKRKVRRNLKKDRKRALRELKKQMMIRDDKVVENAGPRPRCGKQTLEYIASFAPIVSFWGYIRETHVGCRLAKMMSSSTSE